VAHVADAGDSARLQAPALHHARIQLYLTVSIQARADARVEERLVFHVAHGCNRGRQRASADLRPPQVQRALDCGLPPRTLGCRNWARASMDYQRGGGQGATSGGLEGAAVRQPAFLGSPVGDELDTPADRGALGRPPLAKPPLGVRTPNRRSPLRPTGNLVFTGH
jgi:hypothetical protein